MNLKTGVISRINGPVIYLKGDTGFQMSEMVYAGKEKLVGEVIGLTREETCVQVFEETSGLKPGETVESSGGPISVWLAPGILHNIFDGIERPLEAIAQKTGPFIGRGVSVDFLDRQKKWPAHILARPGQKLSPGDVIAEVPETPSILHRVMLPPDTEGEVISVAPDGEYTIEDALLTLKAPDGSLRPVPMLQK